MKKLPENIRKNLISQIPMEMKKRKQWVAFTDKKIPISPVTGNNASCNKPEHWATFDEALEFMLKHKSSTQVGFALTADDPYTVIDIDKCRDPESGNIDDDANEIVKVADSYTEVSMSGAGLHIAIKGGKTVDRCRDGSLEIYNHSRFIIITGNTVAGSPKTINERQSELEVICEEQLPSEVSQVSPSEATTHQSGLTDFEVMELARSAGNAEKIQRLMSGDDTGYSSTSDADQALCVLLNFYARDDVDQIDRIFRTSKRMRPKWDEKRGKLTYGEITTMRAIKFTSSYYNTPDKRPKIFMPQNGHRGINDASIEIAEVISKSERVFVRGGRVCTLNKESHPVSLKEVTPTIACSLFEEFFRPIKYSDHGMRITVCINEAESKKILNSASYQNVMPKIDIISSCPVLAETEKKPTVISGYNPKHRVYAEPLDLPSYTVAEAVDLIRKLFSDYDFVHPADESRMIAGAIMPALVMGKLLSPNASFPINIVVANAEQTGKGYFLNVVGYIYNQPMHMVMQPQKRGVGSLKEGFDAGLIMGKSLIGLDNIRGAEDTQFLEGFMTSREYGARPVGSAPVTVNPKLTSLYLTSNGCPLTKDMVARSNVINLRKRENFTYTKYPEGDVLDHVQANHMIYLGAIYSIVSQWINDGKPRTSVNGHSFKESVQSLDYMITKYFKLPSILDGDKTRLLSLSNENMQLLRQITFGAIDAGATDDFLRVSELADILRDHTDMQYLDRLDLTDDDEHTTKKVNMNLGKKLKNCFKAAESPIRNNDGEEISITLEGVEITSKVTKEIRDDARGTTYTTRYRFRTPEEQSAPTDPTEDHEVHNQCQELDFSNDVPF